MKKLAVITVVAMMMAACGGGSGLDGTYVLADSNAQNAILVISGNKMKVEQDGKVLDEITFTFVEQNNLKGINSGVIAMTTANGEKHEEKYELDGTRLSLWGMVYTKRNAAPQKAETEKSRSTGGGSSGKITMTAKDDYVRLELNGEGEVTVDWGDGKQETKKVDDWIEHDYDNISEHKITVTGKNITALYCKDGQITSLDVSKNTKLIYLNCTKNELTSLDVSKNTALEKLDCSINQITSLDVSKNTKLVILKCNMNQIKSLDLSKCTNLLDLYCTDNQLTVLDVSKCPKLAWLYCGINQLASLDVSKCTALEYLQCGVNGLTSLDLSKNVALSEVACAVCKLDASALNALFKTLHGNAGKKEIHIQENPGRFDCDRSIAEMKGWTVR